jgi:phosphatidylinositol-3-phosphatase
VIVRSYQPFVRFTDQVLDSEFLVATCALVLGTHLTPMASASGGPGGSVGRPRDRDHERDDDRRHIKHVFVIVLENEGFDTTFGPQSKAPYLSKTLTKAGVLLPQYYGTGHASLDNYIAMISGQAATVETRNDCQIFADFAMTGITADGQTIGHGCVYPDTINTLPDQLTAIGKTWRAYMGDMGNDPNRESATCGHPVLNTLDRTQSADSPVEHDRSFIP